MSPRRGPGWVPKLTHRKKDGVGRVRIPGRPDIYFGPTGVWPAEQKKPPRSVQQAYERVVAEWLSARSAGLETIPDEPGGITIAQLILGYKRYAEQTYRKRGRVTSQVGRIRNACKPLRKLFGNMAAGEFGPREFRLVRDELMRDGKKSAYTVSVYGSCLRQMFEWSAEEGLISEATALALRGTRWFRRGQGGKKGTSRGKAVPDADVEAILPHLLEPMRSMARLQRLTGMRPEEVCWMRSGDVTEEADGLWKYEARDDANKLAHHQIPKIVFIGPQAQAVLLPWLAAARRLGPDAWVFPARVTGGQRGSGAYRPASYSRALRLACEKAGVPEFTANRLRHSRATETRRRYGIEGAQHELGHARVDQTEVYADKNEELKRKIARESG